MAVMTEIRAAGAVLEIDLAAIGANWRLLSSHHGGAPVAAVVKADAYGTGAAHVAPYLYGLGCRHFFTATLDEALALQPLLPEALLAPLNGLSPGSEPVYAGSGIVPVLCSLHEIALWRDFARSRGHTMGAILHIDTGINRRGLSAADVRALAESPGLLDGIALRFTMTHLASAEEADNPENAAQLARYSAAVDVLPPAPTSIANSSGLFLGADFHSGLARPGAALYGLNPTPGQPNPLRPAVTLRARVLQVREVAPGEAAGYNATWRAQRPSRIAVVGVGYADGYPRALSNRGHASAEGVSVPLVGRVSMDLTMFDITDAPQTGQGDWLGLIGPGRSLDDVASEAGTIGYEILTRLGRRYARVWHG